MPPTCVGAHARNVAVLCSRRSTRPGTESKMVTGNTDAFLGATRTDVRAPWPLPKLKWHCIRTDVLTVDPKLGAIGSLRKRPTACVILRGR